MGIQRAADGELLEPNLVREMLAHAREPAWMQRQMELGPLLLQLLLSPWPAKRELLHRYPDLADPVRRELSRRVMLKAVPEGEARDQLTALIIAHDTLLDRCAEVLRASLVAGQDLRVGIDSAFADPALAAAHGAQPLAGGTPAPSIADGALPPAVEAILVLAKHGELDEAIARAVEHCETQEREHGATSLHAAGAYKLLARLYLQAQRATDAADALEHALALYRSAVGDAHPLTVGAVLALGDAMMSTQPREALAICSPIALAVEQRFAQTRAPDDGIAACRMLHMLGMLGALCGDARGATRALTTSLERLDRHRDAWSASIDVAALRAEIADTLAAILERTGGRA